MAIGTITIPWERYMALAFEESRRANSKGDTTHSMYGHTENFFMGVQMLADVSGATRQFVERLAWFELNPTTGRVGVRDTVRTRQVLSALGWELELWLEAAAAWAIREGEL